MATKKGICKNVFNCTKADANEILEIDEFQDFICPECKSQLEEVDGKPGRPGDDDSKRPFWKKYGKLTIAAVVVIIIAIIAVVLATGDGKKSKKSDAGKESTTVIIKNPQQDVAKKPEAKKEKAAEQQPAAETTIDKEGKEIDGIISAAQQADMAAAAAKAKADSIAKAQAAAAKKKAAAVTNGRGTINLGYGKYTGDIKNGKPHGYGKITFTKNHRLSSTRSEEASPGDTYEGDFRDGRISGAGYFTHNGNRMFFKP